MQQNQFTDGEINANNKCMSCIVFLNGADAPMKVTINILLTKKKLKHILPGGNNKL